MNEKIRRRSVYLLPNLITTLSLFSGFYSILLTSQGQFENAVIAILFAGIMDGLDGKVARLTNTASEFGIQYDSLADLVAFGVAPALLMWHWHLYNFGRLGIAISFIFAACAALRLARFNVSTAITSKTFFIGLPSPAAAISAVTFVFFANYIPDILKFIIPYFVCILTLGLGLLMVSRVRYFSFKEYGFARSRPFRTMVIAILLFSLIIAQPKVLGFLVCLFYVGMGLVYTYIMLPRRNNENLRKPSTSSDLNE